MTMFMKKVNLKKKMKIKAYPCIEHGDIVWSYMGPPKLKPPPPVKPYSPL